MWAVVKQHYEMSDSLGFLFRVILNLPYARHRNHFLFINRSWILTIDKDRIVWKNLLDNKEMVFKNGVKYIQAKGYDGVRTVGSKSP